MLDRYAWKCSYLAPGLSVLDRLCLFISSVAGAGDSPLASGTVGSFVALLLFYPISQLSWTLQIVCVVCVFFLGVATSHQVVKKSGIEDDGRIVIDEVVGMWLTLMFFPPDLGVFIGGFFLFRILDIFKPFPANYCDQKMHGGWGVMLDDTVSGIYAQVIMRAMLQIALWVF